MTTTELSNPRPDWRNFKKSSFSDGGNCIEIAISDSGDIKVRDSKHATGPTLSFTRNEWKAFLDGVRSGEFDVA